MICAHLSRPLTRSPQAPHHSHTGRILPRGAPAVLLLGGPRHRPLLRCPPSSPRSARPVLGIRHPALHVTLQRGPPGTSSRARPLVSDEEAAGGAAVRDPAERSALDEVGDQGTCLSFLKKASYIFPDLRKNARETCRIQVKGFKLMSFCQKKKERKESFSIWRRRGEPTPGIWSFLAAMLPVRVGPGAGGCPPMGAAGAMGAV